MQTIILAGGIGKRVYPLGTTKPKPMFRLLGKPLLQHVIETLKEAGLEDFIIVTGHNGEQIKNHFGDGRELGVNIQYTHQPEALGMANALATARDLITDNFLVVNGDDIFESSLIEKKVKTFKQSGADVILSCKPVEETWKFGIIKVDDGRVTQFVEKPLPGQEPSNLAVIGAYILTPKIFNYYQKIPVSDHQYEDTIQKFIEDGNTVKAVSYDGVFSAYKYPWDLFTINQHLMDKYLTKPFIENGANISEKAELDGNVWVSKGGRILENVMIRGPCYIGENSLIGNNALIWNYSSIGANSVVGFSTEIKNSLIGENCWFHTNYIGDSIIGDNCSFGSGAITANFRFDAQNVKAMIGKEKVDSGRDKLGAIMADNCKVGVNSTLMPGVKIGPNSIVGPNVNLQEDLPQNKIILLKKESYVIKDNEVNFSVDKKTKLKERLKF